MKGLTKRQGQILEYFKVFYRKNGMPPTVRELADRFKMKSSSMFDHLTALENKKYVKRRSNKSRALEITEFVGNRRNLPPVTEVPILGRVAAGRPLLAVENLEGTVAVDKSWISSDETFGLKVKGDSMIEAHILDGDVVLVKKDSESTNGEIVVALLGEEATVKTFYRERNRIRLQPENRNMEPIYVDPKSVEFSILGKVVGVLRKY
jgi:repressor LexA